MINVVWCNPLRLGITEFKRRPNVVGLVDEYRTPGGKGSMRRVCIVVGPKTYSIHKSAARYCTAEEVAAARPRHQELQLG